MAVTPKVLIQGQTMGTALTTYYTAVNAKTLIDKLTMVNNQGTAAVTANVYLVHTGSSATVNTQVIASKSLAVNETYTFPEIVGHSLEAGGHIAANVSAATSVTIRAAGREVT